MNEKIVSFNSKDKRHFTRTNNTYLYTFDFDDDGHGLWNINFVDVSIAQLAKASMISWATRIGAVPGSIPESKLTYN